MNVRMLLSAALLCVSAPLLAGESDPMLDPRIDAWAYGTVWGIENEAGMISINGQLSKEAVAMAGSFESALKAQTAHEAGKLAELRGKMDKLEKREIRMKFDGKVPLSVMQCPVKPPLQKTVNGELPPPKVIVTDLKIGDVVLLGYDAESHQNTLLAAFLIDHEKETDAKAKN